MKRLRSRWVIGVVALLVLVAGTWWYALSEEVVLTTYYPAPYGKYNKLQAKTLTVSDKIGIGTTTPVSTLSIFGSNAFSEPYAATLNLGPRPDGLNTTLGMFYSPTVGWHQNADPAGRLNFHSYSKGRWPTVLSLHENKNVAIGSDTTGNARLRINSTDLGDKDYALFTDSPRGAGLVVQNNANAALGTHDPDYSIPSSLKKGDGGYLNVKDVYLRDSGKWASQSSGGSFGGMYRSAWSWNNRTEEWAYPYCVYKNPFTDECSCPSGFSAALFNQQAWPRDTKEAAYYCYKI